METEAPSLFLGITLVLTTLGTSFLSAIIGMGGGVALLSILSFFLPFQVLIPLHGITQLTSNAYRTFLLRKHIVKRFFIPYVLGTPIGTFLAITIIKSFDKSISLTCISLLIFYTLFKPKKLPPLKIPDWCWFFIGIVSAMLSILAGATGPLLAPFFVEAGIKKEEIIATKSSLQIIGHFLKIPTFLYLGFDYLAYTIPILLMIAGSLIGTRLGVTKLGGIDESLFRKIFKTALFLAALRLIWKVLKIKGLV